MKRGIDLINEFYNTNIGVRSRESKFRLPRQVYFYVMSHFTSFTLTELGKELGYHHATLCHSKLVVANDMKYDLKLRSDVKYLSGVIKKIYKKDAIKKRSYTYKSFNRRLEILEARYER